MKFLTFYIIFAYLFMAGFYIGSEDEKKLGIKEMILLALNFILAPIHLPFMLGFAFFKKF